MANCSYCSAGILSMRRDGLFVEDDEHLCDCGSVNTVSFDGGELYVSSWCCPHGIDGETPCEACDLVDAGCGVAPEENP